MDKDNMTFEEFRKTVKHVNSPRKHEIKNSFETKEIYRYIRRNKWVGLPRPVTEHEFHSIIRSINNYLAENLVEGHDVKFPHRMGKLELIRMSPTARIVNGELKTGLPVDWDSTLKLWYTDEEAFRNKILVRRIEENVYRTIYNKHNAFFKNKTFFTFRITRGLKQKLKKAIKDGHLDAITGYKMGPFRAFRKSRT